jgi:hypothetical protein
MPGKNNREKNSLDAAYIRLESLSDLARFALGSHSYVKSVVHGKNHRLMLEGEVIGPSIVYYFDSTASGRYLLYAPDSDGKEKVSVTSSQGEYSSSLRFPIVELSKDPRVESTNFKKVECVMAKDVESLVRALVSAAAEYDYVPKIYSFNHSGSRYFATMDLFGRKEHVLVYAKSDEKAKFAAYKYDYINDRIEHSDSVSNGGTYIRVINLAEPFQFFKP